MAIPRLPVSSRLLAVATFFLALALQGLRSPGEAREPRPSASVRDPAPAGGGSEARSPESSRTAARYGLLWLDVDPGDSQVALDGEFLDRGVWLISLAPGLHDLSVRKEGYRPYTRRIGIGPGESLRLEVRLDPEAGAR